MESMTPRVCDIFLLLPSPIDLETHFMIATNGCRL
jgi:hypothetical protein